MAKYYITYCIYLAERSKISDVTNIAFALESLPLASSVTVCRAMNSFAGSSLLFQDEKVSKCRWGQRE